MRWVLLIELNLYFKIGNFIDIDFNEEEKTFVSMVKSAETFDDVLEYSKVIWEYAKEELEEKKKEQEKIEEMNPKAEMEDGDGDNEKEYRTTTQGTEGDSQKSDVEKEDEWDDEDDGLDYDDQAYSKGGISLGDEPQVETAENLEESLKDLVNEAGRETLYVEKPNDLILIKLSFLTGIFIRILILSGVRIQQKISSMLIKSLMSSEYLQEKKSTILSKSLR